jgi:hypothetical protein
MFVDQVILSADPSFHPRERGIWDTVLDRELAATPGGRQTTRLAEAPAGAYRWRLQLRDGDRLIDRLGRPGPWTQYQEFLVE